MDKILGEVNQILDNYNKRITALEQAATKKPATSSASVRKELDK